MNRIQAQAYWKSVECLKMVSGLDEMLGRCKLSNQKHFKAWPQIRENLRMKKAPLRRTNVREDKVTSCLQKDIIKWSIALSL